MKHRARFWGSVASVLAALTLALPAARAVPIASAAGSAEMASVAGATPAGTPRGAALAPTADERRFLELLNVERRAHGLDPLSFDPLATAVARAHSREMAQRNYFAHESPDARLRTPMQRYLQSYGRQPGYLLVGENLFYCSMPGAERGHKAFMDSEGHRRNILDGRFEAVGVGSYTNARGEYWVTQVFLKRRD